MNTSPVRVFSQLDHAYEQAGVLRRDDAARRLGLTSSQLNTAIQAGQVPKAWVRLGGTSHRGVPLAFVEAAEQRAHHSRVDRSVAAYLTELGLSPVEGNTSVRPDRPGGGAAELCRVPGHPQPRPHRGGVVQASRRAGARR